MTAGSILLGLALLILVGLFLARPFLVPRQRPSHLSQRQRQLAQKEAIIAQIRDIDFDHQTGKLPDDIYQPQREYLIDQAAQLLQTLDAQAPNAPFIDDPAIEAAIEAAVAQRRQPPLSTVRFCPQCGQPVDADDNFCAACGYQLANKPS